MSYFLSKDANSAQLAGAINYILANLGTNYTSNQNSGIVNTSTTATSATSPTGATTGYLYRYLNVAFADNYAGTVNFSSTPLSTNKYYGLRNSNSNVYDTNPADYVWYQVAGGFTGGNLLYYQTFGGLQINFIVGTGAPTVNYQPVPNGVPIDLTIISTATNLQSRTGYAISSTGLSPTPSPYSTSGNTTFPPYNTWGGSETWGANPPSYTASQNLYQIDGIYNPSTNLTTWVAPYLATLKVGSLSAINANLGTITAGTLNAVTVNSSTINAGTTPPVIDSTNHTISSGAGGLINPNGTFAFGTTTSNIVDDGTGVYLNGFTYANSSSRGSFTLGLTANATLMPFGTGTNFTVPKTANTIVTCSGSVFITAYTTTGSRPAGVQCTPVFQILNSSSTVVAGFTAVIKNGTTPTNTTTPYTDVLALPFSFSLLCANLAAGSYTLICNGSSTYTSLVYWDYLGNIITPFNTEIQLNTSSYYYQIG